MASEKSVKFNPANYPERDDLVEALRLLSTRLCPYLGPSCDCKYGYGSGGTSEQTGCPETAAAAALLSKLTKRQYAALVTKASGVQLEDVLRSLAKAAKKGRRRNG